jgi:hypothetical protein
MNWRGCGSGPNSIYGINLVIFGGSEENYDIPQTGKPVSELIFESGTFRV